MWLLWNWVLLLTTVRAAMLGNAKCNDVKLSCPDNTTCCLMATKEYGCCPMPSAVCCSDGLHCCPSNSKCDQTLGTCIKQDTVLRFFGKDEDSDVKVSQAAKMEPLHPHDNIIVFLSDFQKNSVPMEKFRSQPTTCPDGKSECPSGTCCMLRSGQYGCCDLQDAVCCDDGVHCCPQDFTCDVEHRSCKSVRLGVSISWVDKKPSIAHPVSVQADPPISCRDNKTFCEQNDTCCNITKGFGCCPLKDAVCCLDGMHCCPFGTHCDIPNRRCYKSDTNWEQPWVDRPPLKRNYPLIVNIEADKEPQNGNPSLVLNEGPSNVVGVEKISAVICPDGQMCADGQTCCQMSDESYGCCSYSDAVCCSDHIHCCPQGCRCDYVKQECVGGWVFHRSCKNQTSVICPGGKAECSDGETCCMLESGNWGCCPQPQAVCCSDHIHCCPEGFRCDIPARACKKAEEGIPWSEKQHAVHSASVVPVTDIFCPDGSPCSDNNTCCKLKSGDYGCCPVPKAVCCSDLVHCCPEGYICNEITQSCEKSAFENIWLVKKQFSTVLTRLLVQTVVCPDQSECPDGNTCCQLSSGSYGCCPLPKAVCCSDEVHCCPSGTTCDVAEGKCLKGKISTPWLEKHPAVQRLSVQNVVCPDQTSACPDDNTCCLMSSGSYGCCPLPEAVCCSDEVHCCPSGTTCDVAEGKCLKGEITTPWLEKHPAVQRLMVQDVVCPDQTSECPDDNTCCLMSSGSYGCCPLPQAVCCSDEVHCCPSGTTCDVAEGKCLKGEISTPWLEKQPAVQRLTVQNVVCPDQTSACPDDNTCCLMSSGSYGCCPLPKAVCCSDEVHCCPSGTTCDVAEGKCLRGEISTSWLEKHPAVQRLSVQDVVCPDQTSECPDGNTCCMMSSGSYGCCPLPKAVCCSDEVHCCPSGTTCDVAEGKCLKGEISTPWLEKHPAVQRLTVQNVVCPDQTSACPDDNTCCLMSSGSYGCCPLPKAVCCSDEVHCCPSGTTCDVAEGKCLRGEISTSWLEKHPAVQRLSVQDVVCPDQTSECPDGNTCCMMSSGSYGCCPLPKAVCCSDEVHCCPSGTTCDVAEGKCLKGEISTPWLEKHPAVQRLTVQNVVCPDQTSACPDDNTCCLMSSGSYGCCPLPKAVCCSDEVHCCPSGTTCDVAEGKCLRGEISTSWLEKHPAVQRLSVQDVVCPDQTSECPDGNTCCMMSSGSYGCCPLPKAVCCSDEVHCCPSGTTCDVAEGKCLKGEISTPWLEKHPAVQRLSVQNVVCPDQTSACPDDNTCCLMSSGSYGCCPLPQAVCCSDEVHCCPSGTTCDVAEGKCLKGEISTSWLEKHPAVQRLSVQDVVCPDQTSECPDGNTCCMMSSGSYGCCPLPKAVCCSDEVHCCPSGTTCDMAEGKCLKGEISTPWLEKHPAVQRLSVQNVVCPDQTSECPDGNTCCLLSSGNYGCCPLPKAVCCSDDVHCCPSGTTCDVAEGKCLRGKISTPWLEKQPAVQRLSVQNVVCPDQTSECPDGNTCCLLSSGNYGCCPLPKAVCCSDDVHCCPSGTTCDVAEGKCLRGKISTPWLEKQPAVQRLLMQGLMCGDGKTECPNGNTCCNASSGGYGCCPLPEAVCCNDKLHCCPQGYTCNDAEGSCRQGEISTPWLEKQPAIQRMKARNIICPDQQSECPDGNTCCKMQSGQYGCCPQPEAVCCSDGLHCCSKGYQCDTKSGQCFKEQNAIAWQEKLPSLQRDLVGTVYCPDFSQCPDGNTCCKMSSGDYGCCPLPSAVCCDDGAHCCPADYTCVTATGQCIKDQQTISWVAKQNALPRLVNSIICPDKQSECQDGQTCCPLSSGGYGCCPLLKAVCCPDHLHCCPENYTCNTASGSCTLNESTKNVPWIKKVPAMTLH